LNFRIPPENKVFFNLYPTVKPPFFAFIHQYGCFHGTIWLSPIVSCCSIMGSFTRQRPRKDILQVAGASLIAIAAAALVFVAICARLGKDAGFGALLVVVSFNMMIGVILLLSARPPVGASPPAPLGSHLNPSPGPAGATFVAEIHDHTTFQSKPPNERPGYDNQKTTAA
jgi:hypothetical protein